MCLYLQSVFSYLRWTLFVPLRGTSALISALTAGVRASGKRGAPSAGRVAVSVLISSVTFKLSLEAAAAAGHVRQALGCWGRIFSAGSRGKERPRAGRLGTCEGGAESAQAWGAAQLELQGCGGRRSTWELQYFESGKETSVFSFSQVKSHSL